MPIEVTAENPKTKRIHHVATVKAGKIKGFVSESEAKPEFVTVRCLPDDRGGEIYELTCDDLPDDYNGNLPHDFVDDRSADDFVLPHERRELKIKKSGELLGKLYFKHVSIEEDNV